VEEKWELKAKIEALLIACDHAVTIQPQAQCLNVPEDEIDEALREFEADLVAADRGIQLRRRPHGQFALATLNTSPRRRFVRP
jgi:chromosome segregation and condensation protein ScpB